MSFLNKFKNLGQRKSQDDPADDLPFVDPRSWVASQPSSVAARAHGR